MVWGWGEGTCCLGSLRGAGERRIASFCGGSSVDIRTWVEGHPDGASALGERSGQKELPVSGVWECRWILVRWTLRDAAHW